MKAHSNYLSAAPSWYCSRVCDFTEVGILVFAAKNSIFWVDAKIHCNFLGHLAAHVSRIVGLGLCYNKDTDDPIKVCSTSEDGKVKVWNLAEKICTSEHTAHCVSLGVCTFNILYKLNMFTFKLVVDVCLAFF